MRLTTRQLKRLIAEEARKVIEEEGTFAIPLVKMSVGSTTASVMPETMSAVIAAIESSPTTNNAIQEFLDAMEKLGIDSSSKTLRGVAPQGAGGHAPPRVSERRIRRRSRY